MKTFRFLGLVLTALFLGVNFTACEDEEDSDILNDNNEPESVIDESVEDTLPHEKKLTEMKIVKNNLTDDPNFKPSMSIYKFIYDNTGRLILCESINSEGVTTSTETYSWTENSIVCKIVDKDGDSELFTFYKWRDDKIQEEFFEDSHDRYILKYIYSEESFKGCLPTFAVASSLSYIHPELFGVSTNSLLTNESLSFTNVPAYSNTEYTYTKDAEGYVESYSEKTVFYFGCHDDTPSIYGYTTYLKWK